MVYCAWVTFVSSRERERDACDVIRYHAEIMSDHTFDYLDRASRRRVAFWASVECTAMHSARVLYECVRWCQRWADCTWGLMKTDLRKHVKTRSLALERRDREIDELQWGSWSFAFAGHRAVDHPATFCSHAYSKKNRQSCCLFLFKWQPFCLWEQFG